jgi:hypothetical protein
MCYGIFIPIEKIFIFFVLLTLRLPFTYNLLIQGIEIWHIKWRKKMLKNLFNSSIVLATGGFILICASSPDESKAMVTNFVDKVAAFSAKHRTSLQPNSFTAEYCGNCQSSAYRISLVDAVDYYGATPKLGTLVR